MTAYMRYISVLHSQKMRTEQEIARKQLYLKNKYLQIINRPQIYSV